MPGFSLKLEIHNLINEYIKKFQNNLEKVDIPLKAIGNHMKTSIEDTFRDEGPNWKKLAASTIKRRRDKNKSQIKILQDTTRLKQSIDFKVEGNQVSIGPNLKEGSNVKYAAIHQFGRTIKHPGGERLIHFRKYKRGKHKHRFSYRYSHPKIHLQKFRIKSTPYASESFIISNTKDNTRFQHK